MFSLSNKHKALIPFALGAALLSTVAFAGPGGMTCAGAEPLLNDPWMVYQGDTNDNQDNTFMFGPIFAPGNDAYYTFTTSTMLEGTVSFSAGYQAGIILTSECGAYIDVLYGAVAAIPGYPAILELEDGSGNPLPAGTWYLIVTGAPVAEPGTENGPFEFSVYHRLIYADGFDP